MKQKIGFVGLGIMGRGMAETLLRAEYELTVYNRTRTKAEQLGNVGAKVADTPAAAAKGSDVVITMLSDPAAVREAVLGPSGVIEGIEKDAVLIDCSTVDPETTAATSKAARERGAQLLDAPVGGSKVAASKGELIMLVGGEEAALAKVRDVMECMSKRIVYAGPSGSGTLVKLCFNLIVSHVMAALSEAMVLGVGGGLKPEVVLEAIMAGVIGSPFIEWKGNCVMDRDFSTNFSTSLMHKDIGLMMNAGNALNVALPVTAAVKELFAMAKYDGLANEDFCSVVKIVEKFAGVEVRK